MKRDPLFDDLRARGWTVEPARSSGHVICIAPNGSKVQISGSPSDRRTRLNERARLRRAEVLGTARWGSSGS